MNKIKLSIVMSSLIFSGVSMMAHAVPSMSDITTQTAEIQIGAIANPVTFDLQPVSGQQAAPASTADNTTVANWTISTSAAAQHAIRWTPEFPKQTVNTDSTEAVIDGASSSGNHLTLVLNTADASTLTTMDDASHYFVMNSGLQHVGTLNTKGIQQVPADTYKVSLDAAIFNP